MILGWLAMLIFAFTPAHIGRRRRHVGRNGLRKAFYHHELTLSSHSAQFTQGRADRKRNWDLPNWAQWITHKVGIETVKYCIRPAGSTRTGWRTLFLLAGGTVSFRRPQDPFIQYAGLLEVCDLYTYRDLCYYTGRLLGLIRLCRQCLPVLRCLQGVPSLTFVLRVSQFAGCCLLLILVLASIEAYYISGLLFRSLFSGVMFTGVHLRIYNACAVVVLNFLTNISKEGCFCRSKRGISYLAAGFVAFVARLYSILSTLPTLRILTLSSASKHAEMWRTVNEWHPALHGKSRGYGFPHF